MRKQNCAVRTCLLIMMIVLLWRCIGAPVSAEDCLNLKTEFWQARKLMPSRIGRISLLWIGSCQFTKEETKNGKVIRVYAASENKMIELPLEEYVCGVTAAEMPAQYHLEALKAQMVAARTRVMWQMEQGGCDKHPGSDICTDSSHCQGYSSEAVCREKWGTNYPIYNERLEAAQKSTEGEWIAFEGEPIAVLYHAASGGRTENSVSVFSRQLPYLVSVESQGEEQVTGYHQESFLTYEEITEKLSSEMSNDRLTAEEIRQTFSVLEYTESGRVKNVQLGEMQIDAGVLRKLLGLRSTLFTFSISDEGITFYQKGYGHGVGMSQAGANVMASSGKNYKEILQHYYTGVSICK